MIVHHTTKDAWLTSRRSLITGTDAAKILGLSKFGGPASVVLDKKGESEPFDETERMEWGRRLEEAILAGFAARRGVTVDLADPLDIYIGQNPQFGASLDGIVRGENGPEPVDAKNIRYLDPSEWGDEGSADVPDQYAIQVHVQMMVLGAAKGHLAVLFSGQELRTYTVPYDATVARTIVDVGVSFWDRHITNNVPPPPDGSEALGKHLAKRFATHTEDIAQASPQAIGAARELKRLREEADRLEMEIAIQTQIIKEEIAGRAGIQGPGFKITWKQSADVTTTDYRGVALDLCTDPDLFKKAVESNTSTKPGSRRFLPKFTNKEK